MFSLNPVLKQFWCARARNKALYGGRASSKSHDAAGFAVYLASNYKLKFLCARQFQNRINESVYTLIKDKIETCEFKRDFEFTKNSIKHKITGSEFLFYGIARNLSEIKSTEGVDILWMEEAHYLTEEQWNIINPTIRKEGSQIWLIWNPDEVTDFIWQRFIVNTPPDTIKQQVNWDENPFLSQTMIKMIEHAYEDNPKLAEHIYGGVPKTGSDKSFINLLYVEAAINAHLHPERGWEPSGIRRTGWDVADDGDDSNASTSCYGNVVFDVDEWDGLEDELMKSAQRVYNTAEQFGGSVTYDSIGVGAFAGSKFKEINRDREEGDDNYQLEYDAFNAGGKVDNPDGVFMELPHRNILNKDHYSNIKAQKWDEIAIRFQKTYEYIVLGINHPVEDLISINSSTIKPELLKRLILELAQPRKDTDMSGKRKVESKKDMLKRGVKSPNLADSFIMGVMKPMRDPAGFWDL